MNLKPLLFVTYILCSLSVHAEGHKAYGLEFGAAISLPECQKKITESGRPTYGLGSAATLCIRAVDAKTGVIDLSSPLFIAFPLSMAPAHSSTDMIGALLIEGKLELITVWTRGLDGQDAVFDDLVGKYGKPTSSARSPIGSGYGSPMGGIQATWNLGPELQVVFSGVLGSMKQGLLLIGSKKGHEEQARRLQRGRTSGRTPL